MNSSQEFITLTWVYSNDWRDALRAAKDEWLEMHEKEVEGLAKDIFNGWIESGLVGVEE